MMKKSGTYTNTMGISQIFSSMTDHTCFAFLADYGSVICNELDLDQSYQGVSIFVVRLNAWRGFAIASFGTTPVWIAGISEENQLQWRRYAQKDELGMYVEPITDCNNAITPGKYWCNGTVLNAPIPSDTYGTLNVETAVDNMWILQTFFHVSDSAPPAVYLRSNINLVGWSKWIQK